MGDRKDTGTRPRGTETRSQNIKPCRHVTSLTVTSGGSRPSSSVLEHLTFTTIFTFLIDNDNDGRRRRVLYEKEPRGEKKRVGGSPRTRVSPETTFTQNYRTYESLGG